MRIILATLALVLLLLGCASKSTRSDYLGVKVGDIIDSNNDLVVYECKKWGSTASIWFSSPKSSKCIKAASAVLPYENVLMQLATPSRFTVVKIKELGFVESFEVLLYVELVTTKQRYLLTDLDYRGVVK
jgi:hypothetical protein